MAETNQLLFNLNVPCNPMNMVTQFYNPGPVVIERLPGAGQPQKSRALSQDALQQAPVEFSVVSTEKLAFAMQLARRDMKNKIREQQQETHLKKQTDGKDNIAKSKKTSKAKGVQKKSGKVLQPASTPQRSTRNLNSYVRSVKTQTPPSSIKHRRHVPSRENAKGSPGLVLQSQPQAYSDFERRFQGTDSKVTSNRAREMASKTKSLDVQQKQEIARLNKDLKTCMERIGHLSRQVSDATAVSSPDRTATMRAGLEALMRAERHTEGQRSEVIGESPRMQRKPVPEKKTRKVKPSRARGVLIPASKPKIYHSHDPSAETMHFTQPTESTKSKARLHSEVSQRKTARAVKPAWAPPGSPRSYHKVRQVERTTSPRRGHNDLYSDSDDDDGGDDANPRSSRVRGTVHESEQRTEPNSGEERRGTRVGRQDENVSHPSRPSDRRFPGHEARDWTDARDFSLLPKEGIKPSRINVRRKVQFDGPEGEKDTGSWHSDPTFRQDVYEMEQQRQQDENPAGMEHSLQRKSSSGTGREHGGDIRSQDGDNPAFSLSRGGGTQGTETKGAQSKEKTKDKITDLLVDEILEDAVSEFERVHADDALTRQAQTMENAPTFENMLQELELMETEEERIRQRWKRVTYDDPGTSLSAQGQRSQSDSHIWMQGTPLDAQQMERLDGLPEQHSSMHFTQRQSESRTHASSVRILPSRVSNEEKDDDDDDRGSPMPPIVVQSSVRHEGHTSRTVEHAHKHHRGDRKSGEDGKIPIFVGSDDLKRICEGRDVFQSHLKKTSHLPFGTFDPWKLVERIADEMVDEILGDITGEVGDVVSNYVETLYASEFDVKTAGSPAKEHAHKTHVTT